MRAQIAPALPPIARLVAGVSLVTLVSASAVRAAGAVPVARIPHDGAPVAVRSWLVAGVFPSLDFPQPQPEGPRRAGYDTDYLASLGGEGSARPQAGTKVRLPDGGEVRFVLHTWDQDYVNLVDLFGMPSEVLAYLYCEVESPVEQELYLHVGTNDAGKVWLGGELVIAYPRGPVGGEVTECGQGPTPGGPDTAPCQG